MEGKTGTVCVTGGAGYIGSWLVMKLLQRGYSVHATVRLDPGHEKDLSHLTALPGASERLKIFNADLYKPDSFTTAIEGCDGVFHVAHPLDFEGTEAEDDKIKMAVEGALGILKACLNSKTVKRVVYTSSVAAVLYNQTGLTKVDENTWTDVEFVKAVKPIGSSYILPKTLAEKAAIKFAQENGLDLITLVPSLVAGPFISSHFPSSVYLALALIMGNTDRYNFIGITQMVHIDDIVEAHVYVMECADAKGRYICSAHSTTIHDLAKYLAIKYPEYEIPSMDSLENIPVRKPIHLSSKKLTDLGFVFKYGLDEMYDGAIQCCKEKGFM